MRFLYVVIVRLHTFTSIIFAFLNVLKLLWFTSSFFSCYFFFFLFSLFFFFFHFIDSVLFKSILHFLLLFVLSKMPLFISRFYDFRLCFRCGINHHAINILYLPSFS